MLADTFEQSMTKRLTRTLAGALLAAAVCGVALAQDGDPPRPAREEVDSLVADDGITREQAERRLAEQTRLPRLAEEASRALGAAYGGVWVAAGRIKLGVHQADRGAAVAAIERAGLQGAVDLVETARGEPELVALQHRIERDLVPVNRGAPITIDAVPDLEAGVVDLLTPPERSDQTPAQRSFLATAPQRYGAAVRIRRGPGALRLY